MTVYTVRLGLLIYLFFILMESNCNGQQYPSWYPVNPCHVGCVNCLGCNNVLILNNSSFGGLHTGGLTQPSSLAATPGTTVAPTTTAAPTTRPTRKVTVTTTWYIYPQWCPYCQRQYGHNKKCLPLHWLNQ